MSLLAIAVVVLMLWFRLGGQQFRDGEQSLDPTYLAKRNLIVPLQRIRGQRPFTSQEMELLKKFACDPDKFIRCRALSALRNVREPQQRQEAIKIALERLKDPEWGVRNYAMRVLATQGAKEYIPQILPLDGNHNLNEVIWLASQQVKHPNIKKSLLSIHKTLKVYPEPLYKLLADSPDLYPPEFVMAVDYGGKLGKANIVLRELSERWPDEPEKREEVVKQILKPLALQTLNDKHWFYRSYALYVLAMLKCKDAISKMSPLLQDPDPRVRETAQRALQELGYKVK